MTRLTPHEITILFLSLGVLLAAARILGEIARQLNQPSVLGEILAGILLGPTILGAFAPQVSNFLFPTTGGFPIALEGLTTVAIVLFLLIAGLEVDLSIVWQQGKTAFGVGVMGIVVPFGLGLATALLIPEAVGREEGADPKIFAIFLATALSISALPVIAKTLMDLNLYRTDLGMVVVAAAIFNDLIGWIIFAVLLGMLGKTAAHGMSIIAIIGMTLGFTLFMLTVGRWILHRILPYIQAHTSWPGGILGFALSLALLGAALTEWIGVHAIFGSFLVGVALGDSAHLRKKTRTVIHDFVSFIFAPLFFASIGLHVDFAANFDPLLVLIILVIACVGKVFGCGLGARWTGMNIRESWAIGFGMNSRGSMEIILGLLALQYGLIGKRLFVALVIMALVTSLMGGPLMQRVLKRRRPRHFSNYLPARAFIPWLKATTHQEAIGELAKALSPLVRISPESIEKAVWEREQIMATGIGNRVAIPHARIDGLKRAVVALGRSRKGIDFDAPDGKPAQLIFLILTPRQDSGIQLNLLADIGKTFHDEAIVTKALQLTSYTEFLALLRTESH